MEKKGMPHPGFSKEEEGGAFGGKEIEGNQTRAKMLCAKLGADSGRESASKRERERVIAELHFHMNDSLNISSGKGQLSKV